MFSVGALNVHRLALLFTRIDMALLDLIHKPELGKGTRHFAIHFRADLQARDDCRGTHRPQLVAYINGHVSDVMFMFLVSSPADYIA